MVIVIVGQTEQPKSNVTLKNKTVDSPAETKSLSQKSATGHYKPRMGKSIPKKADYAFRGNSSRVHREIK